MFPVVDSQTQTVRAGGGTVNRVSPRRGSRPIDSLIIGAGPLGMAVAVHLRHRGVPPAELRVLDPESEPLACWRRRAAAVSMSELRSPAWHHIDVARRSLLTYASATGRALDSEDQRPSVELFNDHARHVITHAGISDAGLTGTAQGLVRVPQGWRVITDRGTLLARVVVLALGSADGGHWPGWARSVARQGVSIGHVLEPTYPHWQSGALAVVGGGLSAAQAALGAARKGQRVTMFVRRPLRIASFDTHPRWFRDDALVAFRALQPPKRRRVELVRARNPGTLTPAAARCLVRCLGEGPGRITLVSDPIERVAARGAGARFCFATGAVDVDHVVLATGFDRHLPGTRWIKETARTLGLPLAPSGHPALDGWLQWAPGLYVCGALAELQLGPTARGLAGGRQAARLIAQRVDNR